MDVFDAAERYKTEGHQVVILAGKEYGSGSSRDWAAKGPWILVSEYHQGMDHVISEPCHRSR